MLEETVAHESHKDWAKAPKQEALAQVREIYCTYTMALLEYPSASSLGLFLPEKMSSS